MKKIKWFFIFAAFFAVCVVGYYGYSFVQFGLDIQKDENDSFFQQFPSVQPSQVSKDDEPPKWEGKQRVNILLLGGDSRDQSEGGMARSDSMMVVSVDPVSKKAHLLSVLRDTYVQIPNYGYDRINVAITLGGPRLAMRTVGDLIGMPIQYFVYTDFLGFMALVDALGGIEFEVEKDMYYIDPTDDPQFNIDLKAGLQRLDGNSALQYVRFRYDELSDYTRTERQRNLLKALAGELKKTTSLLRLPRILSSIDPYIETNLTITEMIKLAALGLEVRSETINSLQVPPRELLSEEDIGGASVITVDEKELRELIRKELEGATTAPATAPSVSRGQRPSN